MKHAPAFSQAETVSFFGAIHVGGDNESSRSVASGFTSATDRNACAPGFAERTRAANPDVFLAIEREVELGDIKDGLLESIAPAANGDFILVMQIFGQVATSYVQPRPRTLVAHGGSPEPRSDTPPALTPKAPALEVVAILFSKHARRTVGLLSMSYSGTSLNEAIQEFVEKLRSIMPNFACRGWTWTAVEIVQERDDAGLPLRRARIVPVDSRQLEGNGR